MLRSLLFTIGGLCLPYGAASQTTPSADMMDAYAILHGSSKDGFISDHQRERVVAELASIREAAPEVAEIHYAGSHELSVLIIMSVGALSYVHDKSCTLPRDEVGRRRLIRQMSANPASTEIQKLNALNRRFLAAGAERFLDDGMIIHFGGPLDMQKVLEIYTEVFGACFMLNEIIGGSENIERIPIDADTVQYVFRKGWGDCPAGCIHHRWHRFNVRYDRQRYRVDFLDTIER
jgi:hypothetical protein